MRKSLAVLFVFLTIFMCSVFTSLFTREVEAKVYKPVISGNFMAGHRIYEDEEEESSSDDYFFREGWLRYKQQLSAKSYYYFKVRIAENDYLHKDNYDSLTFDLLANYTYQISQPLRIKNDLRLRKKVYPGYLTQSKDYYSISDTVEFSYRPNKQDHFLCTVKVQYEHYPNNIKDNLSTGLSFKWERKVKTGFTVHSVYKISREDYFDPESLTDKLRQSISLGFEYQM